MMLLCGLLWVIFGLSFVFIYIDFKYFFTYQKEYLEMNYAIHSDPLSGIANRYSCDMLIEKYLDKPLPKDMGCIMFELTNLTEINKAYGHLEGNHVIKQYSDMLGSCANEQCFVGRNGGNKFIALFEATTEEEMIDFIKRVDAKVKAHNNTSQSIPVHYRFGAAFHENNEVTTITELIALSNRRITE